MICPACSKEAPEQSEFCPSCGSALSVGMSPTLSRLESPTGDPPPKKTAPRPNPIASRGMDAEALYVPGAIVAGRYRMVALLGKGGMGDVYRAEDLKLPGFSSKCLPRV